MDLFWQQIIIGAAIGGAVLYIGWRYWQKRQSRKSNSCGDCCCSQKSSLPSSPTESSFKVN